MPSPTRSSSRSHTSRHQHKKRFGQNFLNNGRIIQQIVQAIQPKADQHLVEIGPGEAALTRPLVEAVDRLDIIEIDNDLIAPLTQSLGQFPAFKLHHTDALSFDYTQLLQSETDRLRVVGNLPYNISSPLLFHLLDYAAHISDMHFMLQKEVVERITAAPGSKTYGRLSVMLQYACATEYLFTVGPENFTPPPKVDSAIVRLTPYTDKPAQARNESDLADTVRQSFSQKRKTLRNNLKGWLSDEDIAACGLLGSDRAEQLNVADFVALADRYTERKGS